MRTANFVVDASTVELAREVSRQAEYHRKRIAIQWTGGEIPQWDVPCLLFVAETPRLQWAWTNNTRPLCITIQGTKEQILMTSLPHELCHAVLTTHFGWDFEIPLWADEGMAVASELDCPKRLDGRCGKWPLEKLFRAEKYPRDWKSFYGQSYSVTMFLIERYGLPAFMEFVSTNCLDIFHTTLDELDYEWQRSSAEGD